ncbi:hypothetical protein, partial [Fluviicola sp.]|uniref:hypothetical protein n=1 Tax=Fluviicola sp. TaxID=1917219 RepID=UPI002601BD58
MLKGIIQFFAKRGYALILSASFLLLIVLLFKFNQSNRDEIDRFQQIFLEQLNAAEKQLDKLPGDWKNLDKNAFSRKYNYLEQTLFVHVYQGDSMIFWNTNKCPVNRFTDLHFPVNGIVQLQNGWYYSMYQEQGDLIYVVTFGIKRVFP